MEPYRSQGALSETLVKAMLVTHIAYTMSEKWNWMHCMDEA